MQRAFEWAGMLLAETKVKVIVGVISGMILAFVPAIISDIFWMHNTRLDTTAVVRDFPIQKALITEKFDTLSKQIDHLTVIVEKINDRLEEEKTERLKERRHR